MSAKPYEAMFPDGHHVLIRYSMMNISDEEVDQVEQAAITQPATRAALLRAVRWHVDRLAEIEPVGEC